MFVGASKTGSPVPASRRRCSSARSTSQGSSRARTDHRRRPGAPQDGTPITCHTHAKSEQGIAAQKVFEEEGVDLTRVVLAHCGDTSDADYLEKLCGKGSYLGMDRFGIEVEHPFEERVATVAEMCERGHADKMILSQDAAKFLHATPALGLLDQLTPNWHTSTWSTT